MDYKIGKHFLDDETRRQHIYFIGGTGTGKSTALYNLMRSDFERGRGFALIDPHGDLAHAIADATPPNRIDSTIFFDPLDTHVLGFNPLQKTELLHRSTTTAHIVSAFKHIWLDAWGPRLEYILTNSLRLLLENPDTTLVDLPRLLTDTAYRNRLLRKCKDPYIKAFWTDEYGNYTDRLRAEAIAPIQNKVGQFANNPILRDIIGQKSTIDIAEIMNTGKVLICNLSKRIGADPSHLLGALLVTAFAQAAQARDTIPEEQRQDFTLYVDEFQNFATESFQTILSEARKYRLNLVLAHQYLDQLPRGMQSAVLGNASTKVVFRVSARDAQFFAPELDTPIGNLSGLPNYECRLKTQSADSKRISTEPALKKTGAFKSVQNNTRSRYARPR